jgi:predicted amidohydrolase
MAKRVRAVAIQLETGTDVEENLRSCLGWIDRAARERPDLVVLPEFCNHLSWYDDAAHATRVSVELDGVFVRALAERAAQHQLHLVAGVSLRRAGRLTDTSLLFGPEGTLLGAADKQVLIGHENDYFARAEAASLPIATAIGRLGLYQCMDGVICETPRLLALAGAQILCNSLNSFALDEASLHVPVRAAENRVFVVAANKVGPLLPRHLLGPVAEAIHIPPRFLYGAGESQIVAPDGRVLARAAASGEGLVIAELDLAEADDKLRPDGTDRFLARRPSLYGPIGRAPVEPPAATGAPRLDVAMYLPVKDGEAAIDELVRAVRRSDAALLVAPELFCFAGGVVEQPAAAAQRSDEAIAAIAGACGPRMQVATTLVRRDGDRFVHEAVLIGARGVAHRQAQLHRSARHAWATLGAELTLASTPWGRLALLCGDDAIQPETFRLAAIAGAELAALSFSALERWELLLGLPERAAENRVCLVAASRGAGLFATLEEDFTLMTPWRARVFEGLLSHPILTRVEQSGLHAATLHPARAANKVVSHRTHLVDGRPWALAAGITSPRDDKEQPHA